MSVRFGQVVVPAISSFDFPTKITSSTLTLTVQRWRFQFSVCQFLCVSSRNQDRLIREPNCLYLHPEHPIPNVLITFLVALASHVLLKRIHIFQSRLHQQTAPSAGAWRVLELATSFRHPSNHSSILACPLPILFPIALQPCLVLPVGSHSSQFVQDCSITKNSLRNDVPETYLPKWYWENVAVTKRSHILYEMLKNSLYEDNF